MNYYELRKVIQHIVPRKSILEPLEKATALVKEKGRKSNYQQFNLETNEMVSLQRMLNEEEINNFIEVSLRAAYCPMPLNADVWDGLSCPFQCRYCVPSGTMILMADGSKKRIERVYSGDQILSFDVNTGQPQIAIVEEKMSRIASDVLVIDTEEGEIRMTSEHPVWTKRGWIKAGDLNEDDEVLVW
jgi:Pretoxin HINT domain